MNNPGIRTESTARSAIWDLQMPAVYLQHLAREFPDLGSLLKGSRLTPEDLARNAGTISVRDNLHCVANALAMATTPNWYQGWGARIAEHFHGPLTMAWLSAPSLGERLDAFAAYFPHRIPYMDIRICEAEPDFALEFLPLVDVGDLLPLLIEIPMLILQRYIGTIRNAQITAASIDLRYPAPSWHASYGQVFECPVHFSRLNNRLRIPFAWREVPNLGYDESAWHAARQKCDEIVVGSSPRNTLSRVRAEIFAAFDQCHGSPAVPTLERVAERIHLSHRTLIRRLRAVGTSFHEELDDVRKVRAVDLVERGRRVSEVAELLGYNDPGNFTKAFRRWFGVPPSRFRNQDGIQHKTRAARQTGDDGETDV